MDLLTWNIAIKHIIYKDINSSTDTGKEYHDIVDNLIRYLTYVLENFKEFDIRGYINYHKKILDYIYTQRLTFSDKYIVWDLLDYLDELENECLFGSSKN